MTAIHSRGKVYFVGAGPGDPGLITLRGVQCLQRADLVLHDYLVNPAVLEHAAAHAEVVNLGHHHTPLEQRQEEINARTIAAARTGKCVVRLKGGDPDVFGRCAEEVEAVRAAGVPLEIVPGVTAALAAAGYAEIPVTHARLASAVALIAGHQRKGKGESEMDYARLADFPGTLIFYMGLASAAQWSEALMARGKSPRTPVAIVRRCSWPDQQTIRCTLGTVAAEVARRQLRPPAAIVVGEVVACAPEVSWFAARPLFGTRVLVTRPRDEARDLCERLSSLGAEVLAQPAIAIADPPNWAPLDAALTRLGETDWLVFSSANGVRYFLGRLFQTGGDLRRLGGVRLAAIGPGTAEELARHHLRADLVPPEYRAESLAESLSAEAAGRRFLLVRASRGREVLADTLSAAGASVEQVVAYSSSDVDRPEPQVASALAAGQIDFIAVTSSSIARSLVRLFGEHLRRSKLVSISPITSGVLRDLGYPPTVEAAEYTMQGLVTALLEYCCQGECRRPT